MSVLNLTLEHQLTRAVALAARLRRRQRGWRAAAIKGLDFLARGVSHVWRNHRYLTATKLLNMAMINAQFNLKTQRVVGRPYRMKIEPTNICNTRCQLCPTGIGLRGRPKGTMSLEQFKRLVDQSKRYLVSRDLSMWGDPLIVPDIYAMVRYAHDAHVWTYLSSNLHAFKVDRDDAKKLVASGLDVLTCSLHGASQQTFEHYQPGKNFDAAVEKVRRIANERRRMGSRTPKTQLNFVVTRHNEHEQDAFRRLADQLGCTAVFSAASMNVRFLGQDRDLKGRGLSPGERARQTKQHLSAWLPQDEQYVLDSYRAMLRDDYDPAAFNGSKLYNCDWPWHAAVINWDGQLVTCCGAFDPRHDTGNVLRTPFHEIWNGRKYRMARRSFRKTISATDAKDNPCADCPGFMV